MNINENSFNTICCFCNISIIPTNDDPCDIIISSASERESDLPESQSFYCHVICFKEKLHPNIASYLIIGD